MHSINPIINDWQKQIIMGTILGGSSIVRPKKGKNAYLSMRGKDLKWICYKASELACLASENSFMTETTHRWHSICYPLFNDVRRAFYDENGDRKIDIDVLSQLKDIGLGIWFVDCGQIVNNKVKLKTQIFDDLNNQKICEYFALCGWKSEIIKERGNLRVIMDEEGTTQFLKIICPQLPYFIVKNF